MNTTRFFITFLFFIGTISLSGQYRWQARDPLDLDIIDFGDNKVLLYNGLGIGLSFLFDKSRKNVHKPPSWEFDLSVYSGYRPSGGLYQAALTKKYQIRKYLTLGIEGRVMTTDFDGVNMGFGLSPTFTWHIMQTNKFRISYDNGVGPNIFANVFLPEGTRFNFSTFYGLKCSFKTDKGWSYLRVSNLHISNADIKGRDRNPPFDAVGLTIGMTL